jgi:hypothetical protein
VSGAISHAGSVLLNVWGDVRLWSGSGAGSELVHVVTVRLWLLSCGDVRLLLCSKREVINRMLWNLPVDIYRAHDVIACVRWVYNPPPTTDRCALFH